MLLVWAQSTFITHDQLRIPTTTVTSRRRASHQLGETSHHKYPIKQKLQNNLIFQKYLAGLGYAIFDLGD
jgi:hypothetical protein